MSARSELEQYSSGAPLNSNQKLRKLPSNWKLHLNRLVDHKFIETVLRAGDILAYAQSFQEIVESVNSSVAYQSETGENQQTFQSTFIELILKFKEILETFAIAANLPPESVFCAVREAFQLSMKELVRQPNIWHWFLALDTVKSRFLPEAIQEIEAERRAASDQDYENSEAPTPETPRKGKSLQARYSMLAAEYYGHLQRQEPEEWKKYIDQFDQDKERATPNTPLSKTREKRKIMRIKQQLITTANRGYAHTFWMHDTTNESGIQVHQSSKLGGHFVEKLDHEGKGFMAWKASANIESFLTAAKGQKDLQDHYLDLLSTEPPSTVSGIDSSSITAPDQDPPATRDRARTRCVTRFRTLLNIATQASVGDPSISPLSVLPPRLEQMIMAKWRLGLWIRKISTQLFSRSEVLQIRNTIRGRNGVTMMKRLDAALLRGDIQFAKENPWPGEIDVSCPLTQAVS